MLAGASSRMLNVGIHAKLVLLSVLVERFRASGCALSCCMSEDDVAEHARFNDEHARVRRMGGCAGMSTGARPTSTLGARSRSGSSAPCTRSAPRWALAEHLLFCQALVKHSLGGSACVEWCCLLPGEMLDCVSFRLIAAPMPASSCNALGSKVCAKARS